MCDLSPRLQSLPHGSHNKAQSSGPLNTVRGWATSKAEEGRHYDRLALLQPPPWGDGEPGPYRSQPRCGREQGAPAQPGRPIPAKGAREFWAPGAVGSNELWRLW